jgi:V8-like Glu-specific endopeptidase
MSRAVENIKYVAACAAVFLLVGFCADQVSSTEPAHDAAGAPKNIYEQTILLKHEGSMKCTGTLVGNGKVLTAGHCLFGTSPTQKRAVNMTATDADGNEVDLKVTKHQRVPGPTRTPNQDARDDGLHDWAILEIVDEDYTPPETALLNCNYEPEIGQTLHTAGFPAKLKGNFVHNAVRVNSLGSGGTNFIGLSGAILGGMSGGGVYYEGRLVGINSHSMTSEPFAFATTIGDACKALD